MIHVTSYKFDIVWLETRKTCIVLHWKKLTFFFFFAIWISVLWKPKDKQWGAGCSMSGKDENSTEAASGTLPFYRLLKLVMVQCVSPDWWEVIHLATYSAWEVFLTFLNDQLRNGLAMALSQPVVIHRRCRNERKLRQATEEDKSTRIIKKSRKHNLSRMTGRIVERRKVFKVSYWRTAMCCFLPRV